MESITFQYPSWYIVLCGLLGLVYALVLYYRDKSFRDQSGMLNWLLGIFRFVSVSLLSILLLSPLLKSFHTETKKPVVILAQDQSESIAAEMDEEGMAGYKQEFQSLKEALGSDYELVEYAFGKHVREGVDFAFTDKVSNISELLTTVYDLHSSQNLGAVILATDGIYNEGSNPLYTNTKLTAPVYAIALGDTTAKRDLVLKRVFHNKIAYLGDKFSVQLDISAKNCLGSASSLNVYKVENGRAVRLQQLPISIGKNDFFTTVEIILDADKSGVQRFRLSLSKVPEEVTTANNSKDIFVDVLDSRQKILIVANSPHPDISAIRQSLSKNKNYEVRVDYISELKENIVNFDFVILHQLPSLSNQAARVLSVLQTKGIPRLLIVGSQSNLVRLNQIQSLVRIRADGRNSNEVQARLAKGFSLFTIDERISRELPNFAPLTAPFGDFIAAENAQVLLYQRIGKIDTHYPLLVFGNQAGTRTGILCAEGLWKWRLFDFLQNQNHDIFEELLGKTIQYISLKEDKRKFRLSLTKNIFNENEPILLDAELYNDSYQLINNPDAGLVITDGEGKNFNYTFNKTPAAYDLNAGIFPVGNYRFRASVISNGQKLTYNGQFSVQPIQLELYETTADHGLLHLLSEKYGGEMVFPGQLASVASLIEEKGTVKPVIYQTSKTRSVISLKWIFFVLLTLLTVEWFLRRYFGGY